MTLAHGPLATALAVLMLAGCAPSEPAAPDIRAVRTQVLGALGEAQGQDYAAEVRARTETVLSFRVGGRLLARAVNNGDSVRAGQVLARLDAADLQLGASAAQAAQRAAQTNAEQLDADLKRFQDLHAQGFIGQAELDRRTAAAVAARAQLDQARAQSAVQSHQADYAQLQAPAAGVVTAVLAEPGQVVGAGTPVLKLSYDGPRDVVFSVAEDQVGAVRALLGREGAAQVRGWAASEVWPATVREVAGAADPVTRTFQVKADVGAAPVRLGQTANVRLPSAASASLRLPLTAVVARAGGSGVWRLDPAKMQVHLVPVTLGGADGNQVLIASGLGRGDEVVTAGTHVLSEGQTVKRWSAAAPTPAASASAR